jgi:hypothetical protein
VERLLKLLNNPAGNPSMVRRYVQEQAITTLAMVADASEVTFGKVGRLLNLFSLQKKFDFLVIGEVQVDMQTMVREDCERAFWKRLDGIFLFVALLFYYAVAPIYKNHLQKCRRKYPYPGHSQTYLSQKSESADHHQQRPRTNGVCNSHRHFVLIPWVLA